MMTNDESPRPATPSAREQWRLWFWLRWRKIWIATTGTTVLLIGIAMLILPGPGWLTIFAGMTILATEFAWARWLMKHAHQRLHYLAPWILPPPPPSDSLAKPPGRD